MTIKPAGETIRPPLAVRKLKEQDQEEN